MGIYISIDLFAVYIQTSWVLTKGGLLFDGVLSAVSTGGLGELETQKGTVLLVRPMDHTGTGLYRPFSSYKCGVDDSINQYQV